MSIAATSEKFASVANLRDAMVAKKSAASDPAWAKRMLHSVPDLPTVKDRAVYLVTKASGKVVLDIGCTGPISGAIRKAAKAYYGIDRAPERDEDDVVDLDSESHVMPRYE